MPPCSLLQHENSKLLLLERRVQPSVEVDALHVVRFYMTSSNKERSCFLLNCLVRIGCTIIFCARPARYSTSLRQCLRKPVQHLHSNLDPCSASASTDNRVSMNRWGQAVAIFDVTIGTLIKTGVTGQLSPVHLHVHDDPPSLLQC